jgi:hypothetical protein
MNDNLLIETTIKEYLELLKTGYDQNKLKEISDLLSSKIQNFTGGFDLHLFHLQKDYLLILAKSLIAMLEFDEERRLKYLKRAEEIKIQIDKKTAQKGKEENNPYKSFLEWLLVLKKYYGSDIDRSNDLLYLVSATEQMMKFYDSQKQQIENQKAKK